MTQKTQIITNFNLLKMSDLKKITYCFLRLGLKSRRKNLRLLRHFPSAFQARSF